MNRLINNTQNLENKKNIDPAMSYLFRNISQSPDDNCENNPKELLPNDEFKKLYKLTRLEAHR
jgi:type IV secretory pathway VirB4 component